jgi:catechol 2,3-dioxygenase-like lactoylglutathione lyase family enzyme
MSSARADNGSSDLAICQVAVNTRDLAGSLRLYAEAFGFANAGANSLWGEIMRLQGHDASARTILWWLVGRQRFFQLEVYTISQPPQAPLPDDWRPSDHGWVRLGIAVADFEATCAALATAGVSTITAPVRRGGLRRVCVRDPYVGVILEVLEDGPAVPGGPRPNELGDGPALVYATSSVADLDSARSLYGSSLGFELRDLDDLHTDEDERLWGLPGARRDGFLASGAGTALIEVVSYSDPVGRPKEIGRALTDQGIAHVALGTRDRESALATIDRIRAAGHRPTRVVGDEEVVGAYFSDAGRELEVLGMPEHHEAEFGFEPVHPFIPTMPQIKTLDGYDE